MDPDYNYIDHEIYLEECEEAFNLDHRHLVVGVDWTQEERDAEFEAYAAIDEYDDGGEGDAKYEYMCADRAEAGF
jgi:hypothetical protein